VQCIAQRRIVSGNTEDGNHHASREETRLDPEEPQNYRPISNLTLISKVIERIVANQLKAHLADNDLMPSVQSAYRRPQ